MDNIRVSIFDLNDNLHVNKGYLKSLEEPEDENKINNSIKNTKEPIYIIKPWKTLSKIILYKLLLLDENISDDIKKKVNLLEKNNEESWFNYLEKNYVIPPTSIYQISSKIPFTIQHQCQSLYNYNHSSSISKVLYAPTYNAVNCFISIDPTHINIWKGTNLYKRIKKDSNKIYMKIKELIWVEKQRIVIASTDNMKLLVIKNIYYYNDNNKIITIHYS